MQLFVGDQLVRFKDIGHSATCWHKKYKDCGPETLFHASCWEISTGCVLWWKSKCHGRNSYNYERSAKISWCWWYSWYAALSLQWFKITFCVKNESFWSPKIFFLDLEVVDKEILKPFSCVTLRNTDSLTDSMMFEEYCARCPEGIFLNALLTKDNADWLKEVTCTLLTFVHSSTNYVTNLRRVCALKVSWLA